MVNHPWAGNFLFAFSHLVVHCLVSSSYVALQIEWPWLLCFCPPSFFFFFPFQQMGVSRPSNNPLGEKLLIFIFTLGGSFLGFILCGTFTPIAMGYSCPLIIIIFKGFISPRFLFIYFTLL